MTNRELIQLGEEWFEQRGWKPFKFQTDAWRAYLNGYNGLVNAPTGSGKTYSLWMPIMLEYISKNPDYRNPGVPSFKKGKGGLQALWITPIRALAKEIETSATRAAQDFELPWNIAIRTGDTSTADRAKMKRKPPEFMITTPESLHLMMTQKDYAHYFRNLKTVIVDEWHELIGSKRGVQMELALSRLRGLKPNLKTWGISATIGNMDESLEVLLGGAIEKKYKVIRANIKKKIDVVSILPDEIDNFPWSGHLGLKLLEKVIPVIRESKTSLIFTNTRGMAEIWYQRILAVAPDLAGVIAMHHGSISRDLRYWVEDALHTGQLKAVVCTSSLDLGVDFRPVETIVQIGSPKGVARFMQRAGRSGHRPGEESKIYFVPTHSLELMEGAALREAIKVDLLEARIPYIRSFDVLLQYLVTLAVSDGFRSEELLKEVRSTFSYHSISDREWAWCLDFITQGGASLQAYDEYHKVVVEDGVFKVVSRGVAMRHRLSIGTIVSSVMMTVKFITGGRIGQIEEWFIARLSPGDVFWFGGRALELIRIKDMTVQVRKSKRKTGAIPSWQGGRMPLSSQMGEMLRFKLEQTQSDRIRDIELKTIKPLIEFQGERSYVPSRDEFLIESFQSREGFHVCMYPFEGRFVHEGIAALLAYRISLLQPITFSIAMNDYGFELLSDSEIPIEDAIDTDIFSTAHLRDDIQASINSTEMARRRFRDIASIAGLVFQGYPGKQKAGKHLQSSSQLFFEVFKDYEPGNLLLIQAYEEVMDFQLEEQRLRLALERINWQKIVLTHPEKPTPFAFPIMVDRIREKLSSEKLEDRVRKMKLQLEKD